MKKHTIQRDLMMGISILISATLLSSGKLLSPAVLECDRMESHPADPQSAARGLERQQMDLVTAEDTCSRAVEDAPESGRSIYHLGRAIYYQGRHNEAFPYLQKAADLGYPHSIFVLAYVLTLGGEVLTDLCKAQDLLRRGVGLEHPWSGYQLVENQLNEKFATCKSQVTDAEISRFMYLAEDKITVASSAGRFEKLKGKAETYLNSK